MAKQVSIVKTYLEFSDDEQRVSMIIVGSDGKQYTPIVPAPIDNLSGSSGLDIMEIENVQAPAAIGTVKRVWINMTETAIGANSIAYEDLVRLAGKKGKHWTIAILYPDQSGCTVTPGRSAKIVEGTHITVADTSSA